MTFLEIVATVFGILLAFFVNRLLLPFLLSQPNSMVWVGIALIALEFCGAVWVVYRAVHAFIKPQSTEE